MSKSRIVHALFTLCVAAFVLASLPHHHHNASQAACFNPLHCLEQQQEQQHDDCCPVRHPDGSTHRSGDDSHCTLKIDVASAASHEAKYSLPLAALLPLGADAVPTASLCATDAAKQGIRLRFRPPVPPLHTRYIARALRLRAPSQLV